MADCRYTPNKALIAIGAGANGTLHRVEGFLAFLGSRNRQPGFGSFGIRSTLGEDERVRKELEDTHCTGNRSPTIIRIRGFAKFTEVAFRPVTHDIECCIAIDNQLRGILPGERSKITIGIGQRFLEILQALGYIGTGPVGCSIPQTVVTIHAQGSEEDGFHQVHLESIARPVPAE